MPTIVHGGHRINVIPSEVCVDIDGRILPGQDAADWARQVQEAVGDEVEVDLMQGGTGVAADPASPFYDAMAATMGDLDPGARLLPFLVSGGTDARAVAGHQGLRLHADAQTAKTPIALTHGHDERTRIDDLLFAVKSFHGLITRFAAV